MALTHRTPHLFHSDQGAQYTAWRHTQLLLALGVQISMSDNSRTQNGLAERFIGILKQEHVDYAEYDDFDDAFRRLKHWLEVEYMTERIHSALDYLTPAEFEAANVAADPSSLTPPQKCPASSTAGQSSAPQWFKESAPTVNFTRRARRLRFTLTCANLYSRALRGSNRAWFAEEALAGVSRR